MSEISNDEKIHYFYKYQKKPPVSIIFLGDIKRNRYGSEAEERRGETVTIAPAIIKPITINHFARALILSQAHEGHR